VEKMGSQLDFVAKCQEVGCRVGLALDIDSPIEALDKEALADLDTVLIMSTKAGFGGQEFDPRAFKKIQDISKAREGDTTPFRICVDGGVTQEIAPKLASLGVDEVVVGKRIFEGDLLGNVSLFLANIKT
jgi:ribulose-phosphate 3-epimerase